MKTNMKSVITTTNEGRMHGLVGLLKRTLATGKFKGTVDGVDDDADNKGHRVFHVTYSDNDEEWISVSELTDILLPPTVTVRSNSLYDLFINRIC